VAASRPATRPEFLQHNRRRRGPRLTQPVARNLDIVAHTDLGGKPDGIQLQYHEAGGRSYLYLGHLWSGGVSIVDVTTPASPEVVGFVPTPNEHTWHIKVQIADDIMMLPCEFLFFTTQAQGLDPAKAAKGARFFDVSDPTSPRELSFWQSETQGVHRSWWNGGKYAYVTSGVNAPGVKQHGALNTTKVLVTLDISDPENPREASRFWHPAQLAEAADVPEGDSIYIHEAIVEGDRAYCAYWDGGFAIVDVSDPSAPTLVSQVSTYPELSDGNTHTTMPLRDRGLLVVVDECTAYWGAEGPKDIRIWDISDEMRPQPLSTTPLPVPSDEEPYESYYERGERFGPHNVHNNHVGQLQCDDKIYATMCNAGLRIYDITDPRNPKETASFVPPDPTLIVDPRPYDRISQVRFCGSRVGCTQDVAVDPRGYIYVSGTQDGIWILKESASDG
jgi:hypothetical protein